MNFLHVAKSVVEHWKRNPLLFVACLSLDALFLPLYGFVTSPIKGKIIEHVLVISSLVSQSAKETGPRAVQSGQSIVALMLSEPVVSHYAYRALILFILLAIGTYVVYVLVQGLSWFVAQRTLYVRAHESSVIIASRAAGNKSTVIDYIARFARINVWWGILASAFSVISLLASIRNAVATALASKQQTDVIGGMIYLLIVCMAFIAMWSYALPQKGSGWHQFKAGWIDIGARWRLSIPAMAIILLSIVVVNYVVVGLSYWTPLAALIGGIVLMLPLLAFARVFLLTIGGSHVDA